MEEGSDSEARRNSVSSRGDSVTTEDVKVEDNSITCKSPDNASEGSSIVKTKSAKVVPETSVEIEDESFAQAQEYHASGYSNDGSDKTSHAEENCERGEEQSVEEMEMRIDKLEEELREVAALEISIYSVIPEHGCSAHKVHTPARRLSRLYMHACKHWTQSRRATVAKNTVSGLVIIARSCGNDVPRLTFWLSNTVVLREIISQAFGKTCYSSQATTSIESNGSSSKETEGKPSTLKWKGNPGIKEVDGNVKVIEDWQETGTFMAALVKVESWIFSRIVESVWWQSLTPNMQSQGDDTTFNKNTRILLGPALGDQQQGIFSIDLWKNAFQDAFQRLCPVRAAGHVCGCLPVLSRMVMDHCVVRLDVAMFNAILRESVHEVPTDPISDPIVDPKVLPIPAGDLSFGTGAQLKNSIGNWCRWLTETLSIDTGDSFEAKQQSEDDNIPGEGGQKSFVLLNSLSDLLMLPKDMLMDREIRKEVCPSISLPLIKRILCNFTPDEFCPDPVPGAVLEALNAENIVELRFSQDPSRNFPYTAPQVMYNPPSTANVAEKVPEAGGKSVLDRKASQIQRKGYTSDEELEKLNSPFTSIIDNLSLSSPSFKASKHDRIGEHSDSISRNTRKLSELKLFSWGIQNLARAIVYSCLNKESRIEFPPLILSSEPRKLGNFCNGKFSLC